RTADRDYVSIKIDIGLPNPILIAAQHALDHMNGFSVEPRWRLASLNQSSDSAGYGSLRRAHSRGHVDRGIHGIGESNNRERAIRARALQAPDKLVMRRRRSSVGRGQYLQSVEHLLHGISHRQQFFVGRS